MCNSMHECECDNNPEGDYERQARSRRDKHSKNKHRANYTLLNERHGKARKTAGNADAHSPHKCERQSPPGTSAELSRPHPHCQQYQKMIHAEQRMCNPSCKTTKIMPGMRVSHRRKAEYDGDVFGEAVGHKFENIQRFTASLYSKR